MSEFLDPEYSGTFGNPDASLEDWLSNPAAADWVKQKAMEHAQSTLGVGGADSPALGFSDPYGNNIDPNSGMPTKDNGAPIQTQKPPPSAPTPTYPADKPMVLNKTGQRLTNGQTYTDQGPEPVAPVKANPLDPIPAVEVSLPTPRPASAPGSTDVSAKKKKAEEDNGISDFAKTLAGVKALQPPPVQPVRTPSVRSTNSIQAPQIANLLQLIGSQSKPDPLGTLGRLLVSGKA